MSPEENHNVYDKDDEKPRTVHKKSVELEDRKDRAEPRENIRNDEEAGDESFYRPNADEERERSLASAHEAISEIVGGSKSEGSGLYNPKGGGPMIMKTLKGALQHRRKIAIGGGVAAGAGTVILAVFFLLIPLKIEHIVTNLEKRFFATSEDAVGRESSKMFTRYMVKYALPSYRGRCGSTIDRNCSVRVTGTGPVINLYKTWGNAKLENKLAKDYGIEFKYDRHSNRWHLKAPGTNPIGDDIGPDGRGLETDFERRDRAAMRAAVHDAFEHETRWKRVMYRYKVGRLLEEKYGIKRCIIVCDTRDKLADKKDSKVRAAKLYLVQRVITPRSENLGLVLKCLLDGCDPTKTNPTTAEDGTTGELNGAPENPDTDTEARKNDQKLAGEFVSQSAEDMAKAVDTIRDRGFGRWVLESALTRAGLTDLLAKRLSSAVPIVGWIDSISSLIHFVRTAGPALQKIGYIVNATSAVQLYQMYNSYSSEIHTGHADATEVGSFTDSLGPGDHSTAGNPQVGGTAGAESAPLYQNLIDHKSQNSTQTASLIDSLLPGKALAASVSGNNDPSYKCQNGKAVPSGQLVCSEEVLGSVNGVGSVAMSASDFLNLPVVSSVADVADAVYKASHGFFGAIGDVAGWLINNIPPFNLAADEASAATSFLIDKLQPFFQSVLTELIPSPFSLNMSGGRTFDMMAAGADVSGNDYAHTGLGGRELKPQEVADIVNRQQGQARQTFDHKPFFARMFDTSSEYSLATKVAMSIPIGTQAQAQRGLANLLNPLGVIADGFASLLSGRVSAAATAQPDPFGITQYGYTSDDLNNIGDPEEYWDTYCSDNASNAYMKTNKWNEAASKTTDKDTGMPLNTTTNPCLLIKATVGVAGGVFDTSNLTKDDLTGLTPSSGPGSVAVGTVSGDAKELAQQILDNDRISKVGRHVTEDLQHTAAGNPAYGSVNISLDILQFLADLGQTTSYSITSITGAGSGHTSGSNHYSGHAVDIGCPLDEQKADEVARKYNLMAQNERCENTPGNEHMHYSKDGY